MMATLNRNRRMEIDSRLRCDHCIESPYIIYRRQVMRRDGELSEAYEHVLWPNGSGVNPPLHPERITCPSCGHELRRVTG